MIDMTLEQEHERLTDELAMRGVAWNDVEDKDGSWTLGLYAVVGVESDTNAGILARVGDGDDGSSRYADEDTAHREAVRLNQARLVGSRENPDETRWVDSWDGNAS